MDYDTLDEAILAAFPENCEVVSVLEHGSTNWSTGLRVDILDGDDKKRYFVKVIVREELVGMAEAEYEGQKAIHSLIPNNAVKPVAWGYFAETKSKAWYVAEFMNLRPRTPSLEQLLPIVQRMHQQSVSPTGKFGFHVTPFYGPPPMTVDWTDNWEIFWVREFRSGLKYLESMRGPDAELEQLVEEFIEKVAARLLRPLQTGGRNIKPSLCHGDLWDGNIQFNAKTQQPIIFDPCSFYGHHEMDFQCMRSPRYTIGYKFIELYKVEVGASEPSEDFDDRVVLYAIRNDLMTAGMWPQWSSLVDKAKEEMRRLLEKYPNGIDGFKGSLEPTIPSVALSPPIEAHTPAEARDEDSDDSAIDVTSPKKATFRKEESSISQATSDSILGVKSTQENMARQPDTPPETPSSAGLFQESASQGKKLDLQTSPDTPSNPTQVTLEAAKSAHTIDTVESSGMESGSAPPTESLAPTPRPAVAAIEVTVHSPDNSNNTPKSPILNSAAEGEEETKPTAELTSETKADMATAASSKPEDDFPNDDAPQDLLSTTKKPSSKRYMKLPLRTM